MFHERHNGRSEEALSEVSEMKRQAQTCPPAMQRWRFCGLARSMLTVNLVAEYYSGSVPKVISLEF